MNEKKSFVLFKGTEKYSAFVPRVKAYVLFIFKHCSFNKKVFYI